MRTIWIVSLCLVFVSFPWLSAADPVDTRQFGLLSIGMSEREVLQKLGEPDQIVPEPPLLVRVQRPGGGVALREKRRATWVYAGDGQILATRLTFEDGVLVAKYKQPR